MHETKTTTLYNTFQCLEAQLVHNRSIKSTLPMSIYVCKSPLYHNINKERLRERKSNLLRWRWDLFTDIESSKSLMELSSMDQTWLDIFLEVY